MRPDGLVVVGRVLRPHGVRGEMRIRPETDFPERLQTLGEAMLVRGEEVHPVRLVTVRRAGDGVLIKAAGIDRPEDVEAWRGALLAVTREQAAPLPEGRHFVFDVLGMVVLTDDGRALGTVDEVIRTPANDVYAVRGPDREILIPAISSVVLSVDAVRRRMVIRPMPGMLEDDE